MPALPPPDASYAVHCTCAAGECTPFHARSSLIIFSRRSWDLGQFERFRRLARDKPYDVLLQHIEHRVTSSLQVWIR